MELIHILLGGYKDFSDDDLKEKYKRDAKDSISMDYTIESFFSDSFLILEKIKASTEEKFKLSKSLMEKKISDARISGNTALEKECYGELKWLTLNDTKIDLSEFNIADSTYSFRHEKLDIIKSILKDAEKELLPKDIIVEPVTYKSILNGNNVVKGIETSYKVEQLKKIHEILTKETGEYNRIFIESRIEDFLSICSDKPLPSGFKRVKWILKSPRTKPKEVPHKDAFREFLIFLYGTVPTAKELRSLFSDFNNSDIIVFKDNRLRPSNPKVDLEACFEMIK